MSIKLIKIAAVILIMIAAVNAQTAVVREMPSDFRSDGCTFFPDGNYRQCCVEHDKDYFIGGSLKERSRSDNRLFKCVAKTKGWKNKLAAPIMWAGVRAGGVSFLPTPFRWGFGKRSSAK